jgi:hypothetical protein
MLMVRAGASVRGVKTALQDRHGIPTDQQRLIFEGKELDNDHTLADLGVRKDALLTLVIPLRAGGPKPQPASSSRAARLPSAASSSCESGPDYDGMEELRRLEEDHRERLARKRKYRQLSNSGSSSSGEAVTGQPAVCASRALNVGALFASLPQAQHRVAPEAEDAETAAGIFSTPDSPAVAADAAPAVVSDVASADPPSPNRTPRGRRRARSDVAEPDEDLPSPLLSAPLFAASPPSASAAAAAMAPSARSPAAPTAEPAAPDTPSNDQTRSAGRAPLPACTCRRAGQKKQGRHSAWCPRSSGYERWARQHPEGVPATPTPGTTEATPPAQNLLASVSAASSLIPPLHSHASRTSSMPPLPPPSSPPQPAPPSTQSQPSAPAPPAPPADLTMEAVVALRLPTLTRIPENVRLSCSALYARLLRAVGTGPIGTQQWVLLSAFAPLVLRRCARGGGQRVAREVLRRVNLWRSGPDGIASLFAEARAAAEQTRARRDAPPTQPSRRFPVVDEEERFELSLGTDVLSVDDLDEETVKRVVRLGHNRYLSKAVQALAAPESAPNDADTAARLRALHPSAAPPPFVAPPELDADSELSVTPKAVLSALKSFRRGSAGGPSTLTPQHLQDMLVPGSGIEDALTRVARDIALGRVPIEHRPYVYGARLYALRKQDGGVRPIACGETLRRLAAKVASKETVRDLGQMLLARAQQVGVGVPGGGDAMTALFRRLAHAYRSSDAPALGSPALPRGVLKGDLRNAFNSGCREGMLAACRAHAPALYGYALGAYLEHTLLFFGDEALTSEAGSQQGDPLAPLFFALLLLDIVTEVNAGMAARDLPPLDACAFFLDDCALAGEVGTLAAWFSLFRGAAARRGLEVRLGKCELLLDESHWGGALPSASPSVLPEAFNDVPVGSLRTWDLLGCPCGEPESAARFVEAALGRLEAKTAAIASLRHRAPHLALTLLRYCAGFPCVVHLLRGAGPVVDYRRADDVVRRALADIAVVNVTDDAWEQASLPCSLGGLSLSSAALAAGPAYAAACLDAAPLLPRLASGAALAFVQTTDPLLATALADPRLASFPSVLETIRHDLQSENPGRRRQRVYGELLAKARVSALRSRLDRDGAARLSSLACPSATAWLYGTPEAANDDWMQAAELRTLLLHHLGLPLAEAPIRCALCHAVDADVFGRHAVVCMKTGCRNVLHNSMRDECARLARLALLAPSLETYVFPGVRKHRMDLTYVLGDVQRLVDFAVTSPLSSASSASKAAAAPGGWATQYGESAKVRKYAPLIAEAARNGGISQTLVPFVADTFGALGKPALEWLRELALALTARYNNPARYGSLKRLVLHRVSFTLARGVARLLNAAMGYRGEAAVAAPPTQRARLARPDDGEPPHDPPPDGPASLNDDASSYATSVAPSVPHTPRPAPLRAEEVDDPVGAILAARLAGPAAAQQPPPDALPPPPPPPDAMAATTPARAATPRRRRRATAAAAADALDACSARSVAPDASRDAARPPPHAARAGRTGADAAP